MRASVPTVIIVPRTNVFKLTFAWDYDLNQLSSITNFHLYLGLAPGTYSIDEWAGTNFNGTNFSYTFRRTNWVERLDRHWAVMTAADNAGEESDPSNEVHWPVFQDDHYILHWSMIHTNPVEVYSTTNLFLPKAQWPLIATVTGTNIWMGKMGDFEAFCVKADTPEVLWVTTFNPNP